MMKQEPMKLLSFAEAIDKAVELLAMEREQMEKAYSLGEQNAAQYFTDTYQTEL